jgi:peptidyl-prolyl cis-trans isomerase A (cyclophilin A)
VQSSVAADEKNSEALIVTNKGTITIALFDRKTPKSVANFKAYINEKFYDGTIFHRVIENFMIQGGGFNQNMVRKPTNSPVENEAQPFVPNSRGTIAMARTSDPDSATSQFFINLIDNSFLNKTNANPGYAVFGRVTAGLDIVDTIAAIKTGEKSGFRDVPLDPVIIESIRIK